MSLLVGDQTRALCLSGLYRMPFLDSPVCIFDTQFCKARLVFCIVRQTVVRLPFKVQMRTAVQRCHHQPNSDGQRFNWNLVTERRFTERCSTLFIKNSSSGIISPKFVALHVCPWFRLPTGTKACHSLLSWSYQADGCKANLWLTMAINYGDSVHYTRAARKFVSQWPTFPVGLFLSVSQWTGGGLSAAPVWRARDKPNALPIRQSQDRLQ